MYRLVAEQPNGKYHFELGRQLAEQLGYSPADLNKVPQGAMESFAGVGYHFDLCDIKAGERVLDLGSGSGMDVFVAALHASEHGAVTGVDMTDEQLTKAKRLAESSNFKNTSFEKSYIEKLPFADGSFDAVISNGVINLSADKEAVFKEISRVMKHGGRMAISDIVTEKPLTEGITCDADLWASCIGGAMQEDEYKKLIEAAGMKIVSFRDNPQYVFISSSAQNASKKFGVKSVSLLATREK